MILHELSHTDVHPLLVALGHEHDVDRQLAGHGLDRQQGVQLSHLRPLGVRRAATDQDLLVRRLLDKARFEGRRRPGIGLRDRHRVVLPVDRDRPRRAFVAACIHDGISRRAPLGDADVEDARLLASELLEEALDHLRRFRDAFAAVRDARLTNPFLQTLDVLIDVVIDIGEDLLEIVVRDLREVRLDLRIAVGADAELRRGEPGRRRLVGGGGLARSRAPRGKGGNDDRHQPAHTLLLEPEIMA